ncbi:MAG: formylglycine-generating enzyme family protein, partial [Verrucomicrobia bacterium]|nr:formylglycine-generating enzyme family protein [Verrucomicrobiota bacterium]
MERIKILFVMLVTASLLAERGQAATNSIGLELVSIPDGSFVMGDMSGDWDEQPANVVKISQSFKMSATEVTLEQFRQFRPQHNCSFKGRATGVSWYDAVAFCDWLSKKEGKPYRLPTEAEWEFSCRAGTTNRFWSGDALPADAVPNPWNLRGMHDAVMEWCADWHAPYTFGDKTDPAGPMAGMTKVLRGDKPDDDSRLKDEPGRKPEDYHRSANRAGLPPAFGVGKTSTRVVQTQAGEDASASETTLPGFHRVGFRVVQAEKPTTAFEPEQTFFPRQMVAQPPKQSLLKQAPKDPYFRKRHLLPTPPENSSPEAIAALGFHPSIRKHNHIPALDVCPNGDVFLVIYTSNFEYEPGVSLMAT